MLQEVLYDCMTDHCPFLMSSIKDFSDNVPISSDRIYINEMASSTGGCSYSPLLAQNASGYISRLCLTLPPQASSRV